MALTRRRVILAVVVLLLLLLLALAIFNTGEVVPGSGEGEYQAASLAIDLRHVGEPQWSMPLQFTASNRVGQRTLDIPLGHDLSGIDIPAGSYTFTIGLTGCTRRATIRAGRPAHIVVTLRGSVCSIRLL